MPGGIQLDIWHAYEVNFRRKFASAMAKGLVGASGTIREFGKRLEKDFGNPGDAEAEFEKLAVQMRAALLESYQAEVEGRKVVPSYRGGAGRFPGALGQALKDPSMVVATANGISYLNAALLNAEAKHWKRLNFGAYGTRVSGNTNFREPAYFDQRVLFYAGSEAQPRPAFALPVGFFLDARNKFARHGFTSDGQALSLPPTRDRFFPMSRQMANITGGIQPRHFIDAGFRLLAKDFGPTLQRLYDKWIAQAEAAAIRGTVQIVT